MRRKPKDTGQDKKTLSPVTRKSNSTGLTKKPPFSPMNENQKLAYKLWKDDYNLMLLGTAGSGKTYLALNFALEKIEDSSSGYKKIIIVRSAVSVRDLGFMPGSAKEKMRHYEAPYYSIVNEIYGRGDAYDIMNQKNKIYFTPTSFLRGVTFDNSIIIVDECQNLSGLYGELGTIITRSGVNSKIIFCGDTKQDDLTSERFKETSGLREFIKVTDKMTEFRSIIFTPDDIVRSDIVKSFIVSREAYEIENYK